VFDKALLCGLWLMGFFFGFLCLASLCTGESFKI